MESCKNSIYDYIQEQKKENSKKKEKKLQDFFPTIKYPMEIKFLDELNEKNKEKYKKWLHKKMLAREILGKSTLIIGVRGKDGIVLGGDRKSMRGGETDIEKKVRSIKTVQNAPIIFASAGFVGVIDDFIEIFEKTLIESIEEGKINSLLSIKMIAEDLVQKAEERYGPRLGASPLHFVLGGLSDLTKGEARLYEIGAGGFGQKIKYSCLVGHGSTYARTIAKYLFPQDTKKGTIPLECKNIVSRIATCIYWIGDEIDNYVGGDPQILYIVDKNPEIKEGKYNKGKIVKKVSEMKKNFEKINFDKMVKTNNKKNNKKNNKNEDKKDKKDTNK